MDTYTGGRVKLLGRHLSLATHKNDRIGVGFLHMRVLSTYSLINPTPKFVSLVGYFICHTMHLKAHLLFLPALLVTSSVLAQLSGEATSYTPDVTYDGNSFVFCSAQDCAGTCEVASTAELAAKSGHVAPNDMGYLSMYWYNLGDYGWDVFTCISYECATAVQIEGNICYNLYENGAPADYYTYYFLVR